MNEDFDVLIGEEEHLKVAVVEGLVGYSGFENTGGQLVGSALGGIEMVAGLLVAVK